MKSNIFIALCLSLMALQSQAATRVGNGGFVIQCGTKTELLDYYQIKEKGLHLNLPTDTSVDGKIEALLKRLESLDPNRAKNYRYRYNRELRSRIQFLPIEGLRLTSQQVLDPQLQERFGLGSLTIPNNCELALVAQQSYQNEKEESISLTIYKPIWDKLDLDTRVGILAHELFYREAILQGLKSPAVRELNGTLATKEFQEFSITSWITKLTSVKYVAMFPEFTSSENELDLEYIFKLDGYGLKNRVSLEGSYDICGIKTNIITRTDSFYKGLLPLDFILQKPGVADLSCLSRYPLLINVTDANTLFTLKPALDVQTNKFTYSIRNLAATYLGYYENPLIKTSGPIVTEMKDGVLSLTKTDFSILQVKVGNDWKDVHRVIVHARSGKLIQIF